MTRPALLIPAFSIVAGALAIGAAAIAQESDPPAEQSEAAQTEPAAETPEQIAARELCTETAAPGAHPGWTVRERMTCENSFNETCRIVRKSDGVEAAYTCYEPLPMPEPQDDPEAEADTEADADAETGGGDTQQ